MNVRTFMEALEKELRNLQEEERNQALDYYEEYFEEAGLGPEDPVPQDFQNVKRLAFEIKRDAAIHQIEEVDPGDVKKRSPLNIKIIILTLLALPVGLPLLLALLGLLIGALGLAFGLTVGLVAVVGVSVKVIFYGLINGVGGIWLPLSALLMAAGLILIVLSIFIKLGNAIVNWIRRKIENRKRRIA